MPFLLNTTQVVSRQRSPRSRSQLRLLRYAIPHRSGILLILVTMGLSVGLDVLRPWPTKLLVDQVLDRKPLSSVAAHLLSRLPGPPGPPGLLMWICIGTIVIFIAGTLMTMLSTDASVKLGQQMTFDLGADLFLHLQRLSLLFHSRRSTGDTISRVTGDSYCVQTLVTGTLLPLLRAIFMLVTMFVIMWRMQRVMTLLSLAVAPFMILSIRIWGKSLKQSQRERRDLEGRMMGIVQQALTAVPAVQAFTREDWEYERFRAYADQTVTAYRRSTMIGMWFKFFVGLVTAAGTAALMWVGGRYAMNGQMSTGTILVFLSYLASLYGPLNEITYTASTWQGAAANADRVMEILDTVPEVRDQPGAREIKVSGQVKFEDVSFGYEPQTPVIKHVCFAAMPGEVVAIVGPTGAGKTTLGNLLVRFFDPWAGRITVDGHDLRDLRVSGLRQQIAMVLQEPFIFPLTAAENIAYGRPNALREEIVAAAVAASADGFIRRLPKGYDTIIGERGSTLSGGEKQRLSIARAFLKNAPILILDEPTSALDARTEGLLLAALQRLMQGRTTFIIAHRLSTIRKADRILVIDEGRIVERGNHKDLLDLDGLYAALYSQQLEIARHESADTPEPPLAISRPI
jgi:ATP-binding cassette, subfamily B, bacterial